MLYLLFRTDKKWYLLGALFAAMTIVTRSIFIIIIAYEAMNITMLIIQKKKDAWIQRLYFIAAFALFFMVLKWMFHPTMNHSDLNEYSSVMKLDESMGMRFQTYLEAMKTFLDFGLPVNLQWLIILLQSFFLFTTISYMFYRSIKYKKAADVLLVLNLIIISMYTYTQGVRYLYPFLPLFIYYIYLGVNHCIKMLNTSIQKIPVAILMILSMIFLYKYKFDENLTRNRITGVTDVASNNTFQFIELPIITAKVHILVM